MSKTLLKCNRTILALARDAYGNGISGNTERSLRFAREVIRMLELQHKIIETKADARATLAFDRENVRINKEETTEWPQFNRALMDENLPQWIAKGLTPSVLPAVESEALDKARENGEETVKLSGADAAQFLADLAKA